jgi:hypothetical protein
MSIELPAVLERLRNRLGIDAVIEDAGERDYYAQDVFARGAPLAAVLRPADADAVCFAVRELCSAGIAVIARGGGMSYTDGFLATREPSVLFDLTRLNRIIEINEADRFVVVEAGVTWAALHQALAESGLRTPYFGPLSGLHATIGGALSQGSVFLGSGRHGTIGDSVLGIEVADARGEILRTGSAAAAHSSSFLRYFGPDLTGLFVGDAGSLGIKLSASLRLLPQYPHIDYLSWQFRAAPGLFAAMADISRAGLASECFAFDPALAKQRMKRASLSADARTLRKVIEKSGLHAGLKLIAGGRNFLDTTQYSLHTTLEANSFGELEQRRADALRIVSTCGGVEIDNSIPKVLRAETFVPPNTILGPAGERWVPVHGVVPHSRAVETFGAVQALFERERSEMQRMHITTGYLFTTIAAQATLIEPVFFWPDSHTEYHRRNVSAAHRARIGEPADNPSARALVTRLKIETSATLRCHGAAHFQLGKFYEYRPGRNPAALALLDTIKQQMDPNGLINPGALV